MKKSTLILLFMVMIVLSVDISASANDNFLEAMQKSIKELYQASNTEQYQKAVNQLERIAAAEKSRWEPYYYASFGYIMLANMESVPSKKDVYLDHAMIAIENARKLSEEESEIAALEGFVYMIRVTVDPGTRGPEFAPRAMETFAKATGLNPENPRAIALSAQMQYGTAQFFGSSTQEACDKIKMALQKFETYQASNPLAPQWGQAMAQSLAEKCK